MGMFDTPSFFGGTEGPLARFLRSAFGSGDPEAAGAVQASQAMEPVTGPYLHDVATGQVAARGLQNINDTFARADAGDTSALVDLAGMFGPGALESKSVRMYNPPAKQPRPFEADYPGGAQADATGRLTHDIDGRPLTAQYVVGRQVSGGEDVPLSPSQSQSVGEGSVGARYQEVAPRSIAGDAGRIILGRNPQTGFPEYEILLNRTLAEPARGRVVQHETAHLIDELSEQIPPMG